MATRTATSYNANIPTFFTGEQRKIVRKTRLFGVQVTEEQLEALNELLKDKENKSAWVRAVLAQAYEAEMGKPFPPDPTMGAPKRQSKKRE